jgi:hypothetical protein
VVETIHRIAMDCVELVEANQEQEVEVFKGYCHMYLPFVDKRYQVLQEVKKESIRNFGISLKSYYEALMNELGQLMGLLLSEQVGEVHKQACLVLSLCYEISKQFFLLSSVPYERYCPDAPETMREQAQQYIKNQWKCTTNNVGLKYGKVIEFTTMHR